MAPRSTDRFLTTHTGSLPRPDDLIQMMYAKESGVPVDPEALGMRVRGAVADIVKKQADAGVDVINDGELSKPSYATYVKDRLEGFGGTGNTFVYKDLADFPKLQQRVFGDPGRSRRKTPACNAPISGARSEGREGRRGQSQGRARRREGGRRLHERGVARRGRGVLPQRSLQVAGGVSLRHRGGDARTSTRRSPRRASCSSSIARTSRWAGTSSSTTRTSRPSARPPR